MIRSVLYVFLFSFFFISSIQSQSELYHRASIVLKDKNPLLLLKAGIPLDHGKLAPGRYFESDFSEKEIQLIEKMGFDVRILIRDVEQYYSNPNRPSELTQYQSNLRDFNCKDEIKTIKTPYNYFEGSMAGYFRYDEMLFALEWMKDLYPNLVSRLDTIKGYKTHDGNVIHYLKISDFPNTDEDEPEVLYTALHHAREPNSLSQMIFYMWYLLENYDKNAEIKYLVDNTEMYFVPCINPDGYKINIANKPNGGGLWRKNGRKDSSGKLVGVDLNRNYGFEWGYNDEGSSPNPGSDTYRGTSGFSEPETSAIREFCVARNFMLALNYHTFGNLLIHPWGYNDQPTQEDNIFKAMGNAMTRDNFFKMGTGSQTVGYTTNGDSDDYLYGETVEKPKIYAYTPEVGPSFWPPKADIDVLNKSCLEMNLTLPRLALGLVTHEILDVGGLHMSTDSFYLQFVRPGFGSKSVDITIGLNPALDHNTFNFTFDKAQGGDTLIRFPYIIDGSLLQPGRNNIWIYIKKDYGSFVAFDSVEAEVFYGAIKTHFADGAVNTSKWQILEGNWGTTPATFTSAPTSITDSPTSAYQRSTVTTLRMANPINLSDAKSPLLVFNSKWSIEKAYDYGAVYAYTLTGDTLFLCGKYTHPGTPDQKPGYPVYDGVQDSWVKEVIDLSAFAGESMVYIDFQIVSDGFLELDGWYIDDLEVISFTPVTTATEEESKLPGKIYPNPGTGIFTVNNAMPGKPVEVTDGLGRSRGQVLFSAGRSIDLSHLPDGLYFLSWLNTKGRTETEKVNIFR